MEYYSTTDRGVHRVGAVAARNAAVLATRAKAIERTERFESMSAFQALFLCARILGFHFCPSLLMGETVLDDQLHIMQISCQKINLLSGSKLIF